MKIYKNIPKILLFVLSLSLAETAFLFPGSVDTALAETPQPEKRTFLVTGYYSPQEGQSFYLRGNVEDEKKLNGQGIRGASGKGVHDGMIAAPKTYAFGTKIKLEGLGIGTVEDRGGAIVVAGERGHSYDRLDLWMGYGEEGLKRALSWGIRKVEGYVYPSGTELNDTIQVEDLAIAKVKWPQNATNSTTLFSRNLGKGDKGSDVQKLHEVLTELGYMETPDAQSYDVKTVDAVYRFQVDNGIVKGDQESGAGYTGQKTRKVLEQKFYEKKEQDRRSLAAQKTEKQKMLSSFPVGLGKGSGQKGDILTLQQALNRLGFAVSETGKYDSNTYAAVLSFQKQKGIILKDTDRGAGYFGNQTRLYLVEDLFQAGQSTKTAVVASSANPAPGAVPPNTPSKSATTSVSSQISQILKSKDSGDEVRALQQTLFELGYLDATPTGYYGPKTSAAVLSFQMQFKLAGSPQSPGASLYGPKTREKLAYVLSKYRQQKITTELDPGTQGIEVAKLQSILSKLGYFKQDVTGKFAAKTKEALLQFQQDHAVVPSAQATGAGRVGQTTRDVLNKKLVQFL